MQRPLRPCATPGCPELTREFYCARHKSLEQKQRTEQNRYYDRHVRDKKAKDFYKSLAWERLRQQALIRDHYLCQHCLKEQRITPADMVHHIRPVRDHWDERLRLENLISLCHACHNQVHGGRVSGVGGS